MTDQTYQTLPPLPPAPEKKNWFARHKVLTGVGALVVVVAVAGAVGSGGGDSQTALQSGSDSNATAKIDTPAKADAPAKVDTPAKADTPATTETKVEEKAEAVEGLQADGKTWLYGDWKISNVKVANTPSLGWFKITSDVTYLGEDTSGGDNCFNVALDKGARQVTTGFGCASSVQPGKTATLDFTSTDDYVSGPYEITVTKSF